MARTVISAGLHRRRTRTVTDAVTARRFVAHSLSQYGAPKPVIDSHRLIVTELVSNALVPPARRVTVAVEDSAEGWGVTVTGGWQPLDHDLWHPDRWELHADDRSSGRGLGLVRALADRIEVREVDGKAAVACWVAA